MTISPKTHDISFGKIIAADTEAYRFSDGPDEIQKFFNIGFYDGQEYFVSQNKNKGFTQILKYVNNHQIITLLFHNLTYDIQILGLMDFILAGKFYSFKLTKSIMGNVNFIQFRNKKLKLTINFLDTFNFFKFSLEVMGKMIGQNKLNKENYNLSAKQWNEILEIEGNKRVLQDCKILYDYFTKFYENPDYNIGISAASTSFRTFKRDFLKQNITMPAEHIIPSLKSYRGGRCEPYVINKEPIHLTDYDINSLYPFVMRNNKYSVKFRREVDKIDLNSIENNDYNYLFNVDYQYLDNPIRLPVVVRDKNKKLSQFYSAQDIWLTGKEILEMYKNSDSIILRFRKGYEYHNDYLFTEFIDKFYNKRLIAKNEEKQFIKLILNSLYGKFGQHEKITEFIARDTLEPAIQILLQGKERVKINDKLYSIHNEYCTIQQELPEHSYNNPLIASEITANARLYNFKIQKEIGFEHIFYTDTDSFFIDRNWTTGDQPGQLKVEKQGLFKIFNPKHYAFYDGKNWCITLKGINQSRSKKFTNIQLTEYNQENKTHFIEIYQSNQFSTLKSNKEIGNVKVNSVIKGINDKHDKLFYIENKNGDLIGQPFN